MRHHIPLKMLPIPQGVNQIGFGAAPIGLGNDFVQGIPFESGRAGMHYVDAQASIEKQGIELRLTRKGKNQRKASNKRFFIANGIGLL